MTISPPDVDRYDQAARDPSLLQRVRAGDASALDELVATYWTDLIAYAGRILDCRDAAEDVAQEAFVRLWERRKRIKPSGSARPLLFRIARNQALNRRRRLRISTDWRHRQVATPAPLPGPAQVAEHGELQRAVERTIAALPARRREVFVLARYHDLSYREIAGVMGISSQTVANQMSAALSELREKLEPFITDRGTGATGAPEISKPHRDTAKATI